MVWQCWVMVRSEQGQQQGVTLVLRQQPGAPRPPRAPELVRGESEVPHQVLTAPGHPPQVLLTDRQLEPGAAGSGPAGESREEVQLRVDM